MMKNDKIMTKIESPTCEVNNKCRYDLSHYLFGFLPLATEWISNVHDHPAAQRQQNSMKSSDSGNLF